jgi:hypothetical protein
LRVALERLRRGELCRIQISPVTVLPAKRRDPALGRDARAGDDKSAA